MRVVLILIIVVASSSAHAEGPVVVRVGIGVSGERVVDYPDPFGPALHFDIGYRVQEHLAFGAHFGITRRSETYLEGNMGPENDFEVTAAYEPIHLGVGATYSVDRFWLAPWLGVEDDGPHILAGGLSTGFDLFIDPSGHRIGMYLELSRARFVNEFFDSVSYFDRYSVGVAYRFW